MTLYNCTWCNEETEGLCEDCTEATCIDCCIEGTWRRGVREVWCLCQQCFDTRNEDAEIEVEVYDVPVLDVVFESDPQGEP